MLIATLCTLGCSGAPVVVRAVGEPTVHQGQVVAARGPTNAEVGQRCSVHVRNTDGGRMNCQIRVFCGEQRVYGLEGAGFNECRQVSGEFVFAEDHHGTRADGDPRLFYDLETGRVIVTDDDPDVEILIDLAHLPEGFRADEEQEAEAE